MHRRPYRSMADTMLPASRRRGAPAKAAGAVRRMAGSWVVQNADVPKHIWPYATIGWPF